MKKFSLLILFSLLLLLTMYADDGTFFAEGDNIFPLDEQNIVLEKEILKITFDEKWYVEVYFEFFNPGVEKDLTIGFITHRSGARDPIGLNDFKVVVNDEIKDFKILTSTELKKQEVELKPEGKVRINDGDLINLFNATFNSGLNTIKHSFNTIGGINVPGLFFFYYKLTTGQLWAGNEIKDFTLIISCKNKGIIRLFKNKYNERFYKGERIIEIDRDKFSSGFKVVGCGKIVDNVVYIDPTKEESYIIFKAENFKPDYDLEIVSERNPIITDILYYSDNIKMSKDLKKVELFAHICFMNNKDIAFSKYTSVPHEVSYREEEKYNLEIENHLRNIVDKDCSSLSPESIKILMNFPYALHGYEFKSQVLLDFFSQFIWYLPEEKDIDKIKLTKREIEYINIIKEFE